MKRIIALIAAIAALAFCASVTTAHADPTGNESCGGSAVGTEFNYGWLVPGMWNAVVFYKCGEGKTFTWEIQHTTNGGATVGDWWGAGNELGYRAQAGCNNGCSVSLGTTGSQQCASTGSYRLRVNVSGGQHWLSNWYGAGQVCGHNRIVF